MGPMQSLRSTWQLRTVLPRSLSLCAVYTEGSGSRYTQVDAWRPDDSVNGAGSRKSPILSQLPLCSAELSPPGASGRGDPPPRLCSHSAARHDIA